jgi:hypothetical protein
MPNLCIPAVLSGLERTAEKWALDHPVLQCQINVQNEHIIFLNSLFFYLVTTWYFIVWEEFAWGWGWRAVSIKVTVMTVVSQEMAQLYYNNEISAKFTQVVKVVFPF